MILIYYKLFIKQMMYQTTQNRKEGSVTCHSSPIVFQSPVPSALCAIAIGQPEKYSWIIMYSLCCWTAPSPSQAPRYMFWENVSEVDHRVPRLSKLLAFNHWRLCRVRGIRLLKVREKMLVYSCLHPLLTKQNLQKMLYVAVVVTPPRILGENAGGQWHRRERNPHHFTTAFRTHEQSVRFLTGLSTSWRTADMLRRVQTAATPSSPPSCRYHGTARFWPVKIFLQQSLRIKFKVFVKISGVHCKLIFDFKILSILISCWNTSQVPSESIDIDNARWNHIAIYSRSEPKCSENKT